MNITVENNAKSESDIIDLREIFYAIWDAKLLVISITFFFAIASVIYALKQPNIYRSSALLSPVVEGAGSNFNSLANQLGGLASIAGVSFGSSSGVDKISLAIQIMQSRKFITSYVNKYKIKPELIAVDGWDFNSGKLIYDTGLYNYSTGEWLREVNPPMDSEPSNQEAYKEFLKVFKVERSKETGLVSITVEHYSPFIAKKWVDNLVFEINENMKERELIEANRSIDFLREQLKATEVEQMKTVLYKLLEEQTKKVMFTSVRSEFAFKTIDPALVMETKARPNRALICILGAFIGAMFGFFIVIFRFLFRK